MLIDAFLRADEEAARVTPALLKDFKRDLPDFLDTLGGLFGAIVAAIDALDESGFEAGLEAARTRLGVSVEELVARIRGDDSDPLVADARELWKATDRAQAAKIVAHLCFRSFRWALADLYRLRLTAVLGHMRVEAEAVALIHLFRAEPAFADRWLATSEDGRRFFQDSQPKVKQFLSQHGLYKAYDYGSSVAQHVRMMSAAPALDVTAEATHLTYELRDQEVDPNDPFSLHNGVAYFARTQVRVLKALEQAFPDAVVADILDDLETAARYVDDLYWLIDRRYPQEVRNMYAAEAGPTAPTT